MRKFITRHKVLFNLIIVLIINLLILSFQVKDRTDRLLIAKFVASILTPLQSAADISLKWIADSWNSYIYLKNNTEDNRKLQAQVRKLKEQLVLKGDLESRLRMYEKLLKFQRRVPFDTEGAVIIATGQAHQFNTIYINKGSGMGISRFQPVINEDGLVGFISMTTPFTSQVQLLTDSNSAAAVVTEKTRVRGIVRGKSSRSLELHYISRLEEINIGEKVYTSGLDGIYPYGIIVGTIDAIQEGDELFYEITVKPSVSFAYIDALLVIKTEFKPEPLNLNKYEN
jgi:rod shape-determining protein MreC